MSEKKSEQERNEKFLELIAPHYQGFFAYARYLTGSFEDAEDLLQSASLNALEYLGQLRSESKFKPWFYRIIHNTFRNQCRRKEYRKTVHVKDEVLERCIKHRSDSKDISDQVIDRIQLDEALSYLPPHLRETLLLFEREGFSIKEVARIMKRSQSTIKRRLRVAREQLRMHYFGDHQEIESKENEKKDLIMDEP